MQCLSCPLHYACPRGARHTEREACVIGKKPITTGYFGLLGLMEAAVLVLSLTDKT